MTKIAREALIKLGVSEADADKILSTDEAVTKDLKVETFVSTITENLKTKFKEDGSMDEMVNEKIGRVLSSRDRIIMNAAKEYGVEVTKQEYEALPTKDRTDELNKLILKKFNDKKAPTGNEEKDKEIERLNNEVLNFKTRVKQLEDEELPKAKTEAEKRIEEFEFQSTLKSEFSRINAGKLVAPEKVVLPGVMAEFNSKYDRKTENGEIVLLEKGTQKVAYVDSKKVTLEMALEQISVGLDIRKKQEPPSKERTEDPAEKKVSTPGMTRAQKALAEMEAERKANAQ